MPQNKLTEPTQKVTLILYASDMEAMRKLHGSYGVATVIRNLVRQHVKRIAGLTNPAPVEYFHPENGEDM